MGVTGAMATRPSMWVASMSSTARRPVVSIRNCPANSSWVWLCNARGQGDVVGERDRGRVSYSARCPQLAPSESVTVVDGGACGRGPRPPVFRQTRSVKHRRPRWSLLWSLTLRIFVRGDDGVSGALGHTGSPR